MMMEQQIVLKSDEIQERWKNCVRVVCFSHRLVERVMKSIKSIWETIKALIDKIIEAFISNVGDIFKELEKSIKSVPRKSYPHTYPQYVHNFPINAKGYQMQVIPHARSRC